MSEDKILRLRELGESIWLDYISRALLMSDKFKKMLKLGLSGMTSNPTIFEKAITTSSDYDADIAALKDKDDFEIYDTLTTSDIQEAAKLFLPVYEKTNKQDGYVSLEINPHLAHNTQKTIEEAIRLKNKLSFPNIMFKVPATEEGFPAVEELVARGFNINITLIFSLKQYVKTAESYIKGIERLIKNGKDPSCVFSVASVFVSRLDTLVDKLLEEQLEKQPTKEKDILSLKGKVAVANCQIIYKKFREIFSKRAFLCLKEKGANLQRVLWGSTSTKNPRYSRVKYVQELIGENIVNTVPEGTFWAIFEDLEIKNTLLEEKDFEGTITKLSSLGIDIDEACNKLLKDGLKAFSQSFDNLLESIKKKKALLLERV